MKRMLAAASAILLCLMYASLAHADYPDRPVRIVTKDGKTITGRRLNEDTYTVQLIDAQEHLLSLLKSDVREYTILKTSSMPSYKDRLTAQELSDLVAYLVTLKGK